MVEPTQDVSTKSGQEILNGELLERNPPQPASTVWLKHRLDGNEFSSMATKSHLSAEEALSAERELERAVIQAIEKNPAIIEALLRDSAALAAIDRSPRDGRPPEAIDIGPELSGVLQGAHPWASLVLRDNRVGKQSRRSFETADMSSFEKIVYKGILPNVVDYVVRNHGYHVTDLVGGVSPTVFAGSVGMRNVLLNVEIERAMTGKLRPFDPATMNVSNPTESELGIAQTSRPLASLGSVLPTTMTFGRLPGAGRPRSEREVDNDQSWTIEGLPPRTEADDSEVSRERKDPGLGM
jgi:hypothetical protein